jgi:hypothetical protein
MFLKAKPPPQHARPVAREKARHASSFWNGVRFRFGSPQNMNAANYAT